MVYSLSSLLDSGTAFKKMFSGIIAGSSPGFESVLRAYVGVLGSGCAGVYSIGCNMQRLASTIHFVGMNENRSILDFGVEPDSVSLYLGKFYTDFQGRSSCTTALFATGKGEDDSGWRTKLSYGTGFSRTRSPSLHWFVEELKQAMEQYDLLSPVIESDFSASKGIIYHP